MPEAAEMPRYQSHKKVWALKIATVDGYNLTQCTTCNKHPMMFQSPRKFIGGERRCLKT